MLTLSLRFEERIDYRLIAIVFLLIVLCYFPSYNYIALIDYFFIRYDLITDSLFYRGAFVSGLSILIVKKFLLNIDTNKLLT